MKIIQNSHNLQVTSPDGGWITKSNLSLKINPMDRNKDVLCYAVNAALGETVVEKHTIAVLCKYQNVLSSYQYCITLLRRKPRIRIISWIV